MQEYAGGKILVETDGPVTIVTINRPEVRNACDEESATALFEVFHAFEADDQSSVAILTGAGGSFSAGADLQEIASGASRSFSWARKDGGVTRRRLKKPVIGAVEGAAVAGGLALAVWCDMRVVADGAVFGVFCRRFGGPMPNGTTVRLPRIIGESRALDMLMTGRPVEAEEAFRIGLADRLVPKGRALSEAKALAEQLAAFPQLALRSDRYSVITQWDHAEEDAIDQSIEWARPAFEEQFQDGAGRFMDGSGRHGSFD